MAMNTFENGSSESRDDELRRTILDFLRIYIGNDPLEPYLRCIKWLKEMTPPGSVQVVLQEVLEVAAKTFVTDKRYKSDLRYLKVWIQYADCCVDRGGIFPYLEANGIGLEHGLFYEAYAMLLESSRDYAKADYVFQVGISRGAQPVDRVILMYNNFRSRMVARQRRKQRQEQEQKAMLARLSGGAQQPLSDNHGMEGLPMLPTFQTNTREDPLPDMQVSGGNYGGPAPVCIGSKIYQSTALKPESSFEEERVRRWIQNKASQLLGQDMGMPNSMERGTQTRSNEVHQTSNKPGIPVDSMLYKSTGQNEETSNGYLGGAPNPSRAFNFTSAQLSSARSVFSSEAASAQNVSMRPTTLHSNVAASLPSTQSDKSGRLHKNEAGMERAGQNEVLDDVTIVTKSVTDDIMAMFGEPYMNDSKTGTDQSKVLDDVTVDTKSVTDDIMAMFSGSGGASLKSEEHGSHPSGQRHTSVIGTSYTNENKIRTQPNGNFVERAGKSEVLDDVTINTKSVTDDIMAMFSGDLTRNNPGPRVQTSSVFHNSPSTSIPSDSESRNLNAVAECKISATTIQQQPKQMLGVTRGVTGESSKSEVAGHISRVQLHRNDTTPLHSRDVVSVRKDGSSSSMSAVDNVAPVQKRVDSSAVGQWATKETRSCTLVESSKAEVGVAQDRSASNGKSTVIKEDSSHDDGPVKSTSSRKRSSWSTSAKDTQCIYISDEDEKIDDRENKKQRIRFTSTTSNEGSGIMESGTPVVNRSRLRSVQQHPAQYSPALCSTFSMSNASPNGDVQRNLLEPTLSRTERSKPGGQIYPWDQELISNFLKDLSPPLSKYEGYIQSTKKYSGKVSLASLASSKSGVKNKPLELGSSKYQLKASTGHGAFAQVYLAEALNKTGDSRRVVLKVQKPPCPWEFYIYRQLDMRIPSEERCSYGSAQSIHIYADCSFMECDFGPYGTLQDVINSYLSKGQRMDEPLCIFYTIEMLHMLESLHKVNLIHGDFKPDNLLIRSSSENLGTWSPDKPGSWKQQGVCLIDWGRSIDISLFADGTEFVGDSKTDGFRCTEMIEKKPWTFQVDTYGLCGVAHCLLHGSYMEIQKSSSNGTSEVINRPKAPYKRYWNVNLWQNFFETLLNLNTSKSYDTLSKLRRSFENYLRSDPGLTKKLRELLVKQNTMLHSRK
ncbi:hypothetical protein M758_12G106700 [Ceratodon purpureus]|nr:hypothetical protein M758_12G106700 [Ceratodon purpureus]